MQKNLNIEKIIFKVVQMKFLAMHITNQKLSFDIFTNKISSWNMILISNDFWHKINIYNFDPYNVFLAISTNIPVLLMTASVLQGHNCVLAVFVHNHPNNNNNNNNNHFLRSGCSEILG